MRSLRDETQTGYVGPHAASGMPVAERDWQGGGVGAASLRWKPPVDQGEVRSFLAYLRSCLHREAVHGHLVRARDLDSDTCACLPAGAEPLFSGAREVLPLHHESVRVMRLAGRHGQALRYGYPLVVLSEDALAERAGGARTDGARGGREGDTRLALPLLTVDVRIVEEFEERHVGDRTGGGETPSVRAIGPPDVNTALLARLGITDPEDLFELRTRLRAGAPDALHRPAAVADLAAKVRTLLTRLEIERVDDIAPLGTRGLPSPVVTGAHNTAVLFRAGPGGGPESEEPEPGGVEGLLADLDPTARDGLDPEAISGTALESLLGARPASRGHRPPPSQPPLSRLRRAGGRRLTLEEASAPAVVPVSATPLDQPRYAALRAAMHDQLSVVAAPPGSGAHDLVDAMVRTAVTAGRRVLVCARTEADVDAVLTRADTDPSHPVVRAGGSGRNADEAHVLTRLLSRLAGTPPPAVTPEEEGFDELTDAWTRVRRVWEAMDVMASGGHVLAELAEERGRNIARGWDPDTLFTPERGGPEYWSHRAERAMSGLSGLSHRAAIRRELGVTTDTVGLSRLCAIARRESEWREAVDRRTRCAPLTELTENLARALEDLRRAGGRRLTGVTEPRLWRGRAAIEHRLELLNWPGAGNRTALFGLLDTLPAWVCRTDHARSLPAQAGMFDLVIVLGAERTRVGELLPVLYRAERAVVIGDPAHPGPPTVLEPDEERRALATAGLTADQLDDRALRYGVGSALRAAHKVAPHMLWLNEHHGAPEPLATAAARHCYGGRLGVVTAADPLGGSAFDWHDAVGECDAAPGSSYVNRDEAYRTAVVVDELDRALPEGHTLAVVAPLQPQVALLRRLLRQRVLRHRVRVGGAELLDADQEAVDVTVLSPMLTEGAPAIAEQRIRRMNHLWSWVLTRTSRRLVVVGDRAYWAAGEGPLADLLTESDQGTAAGFVTDAAGAALVNALRAAGAEVRIRPRIHGWPADLLVRYGARRVVLLLDREPDGASLRRLLARGEALNQTTEDLVVVVPAWRCLADPRALVEEILSAR